MKMIPYARFLLRAMADGPLLSFSRTAASRNPHSSPEATGVRGNACLALICALICSAASPHASAAVVLSEVDLYTSAYVVDGEFDIENPAPSPAIGNQNWLTSASSLGIGTVGSYGNYSSRVDSDTFEFSGNSEVSMTGALAGGNGVAAGTLRVDFTVPAPSTAFLYAVANISTTDGYAFSNPLTRLILTEDGAEISRLELISSGSLSETVSLTPDKVYSFTANIETSISPGATGNLLTSAFIGGSGLAITPVPEPTGAVLALISGVALTVRRRRERPLCKHLSVGDQAASPGMRNHSPKSSLAAFIAGILLIAGMPLSASPTHTLLKDINLKPYEESSLPTSFLSIGSTTYFSAVSNIHGKELWKTDGTTEGTLLVKDTNPGAGYGMVATLANLGGLLLFIADDGHHGREIWRSDGTEAGTFMIKEITPGNAPGSFSSGAVMNGFFYFAADDGVYGTELWKTDGTEQGTTIVKDLNPGINSGSPSQIVAMGSNIYFTAYNASQGTELWKSNGTDGGTTLVKDVRPGTGSSSIDEMTVVGSTLYFSAISSSSTGSNLWKSDGTTTGTVLVKDLEPGFSGDRISQITPVGTTLYFIGRDSANGYELWKSNGTAAGTTLVRDIRPGTLNGLAPTETLHVFGSTVVFFASGGNVSSFGLWKSDGTSAGTTFLATMSTSPSTSTSWVNGGTLYLQLGSELWKTNGTPASTVEVLDGLIELQSGLVSLGSTILFAASQPIGTPGSVMTELWKSNGSIGNHELVKNIRTRTSDSNPASFVVADGRVFFEASDGIHGQELWSSDGTEEGTTLTRDIRPGSSGIGLLSKIAVGGDVYFPADDGSHGVELWRSDGTEAGTTMVADIQSGAASSMAAGRAPIGALGNLVFFGADDGVHGTELWITDGTAANTLLLKDINPGIGGSNIDLRSGVVMDGILYFHAHTDASGTELWRTDGTVAGTYMVVDIGPGTWSGVNGSYSPYPNGIVVEGQLYFSANNGGTGFELWRTDGTASGTSLVKDIHPSGSSFDASFQMYAHAGLIYFYANDGSSGRELWRSDGTNGGTYMLKDIEPGAMGSGMNFLTGGSFDGKFLFLASDSTHGTEIWQTDGTETGTTVIDIKSGPESAVHYNYTGQPIAIRLDGVYFTGSDGELWKTDGTISGSHAIVDEHLYAASDPRYLSIINNKLIFSAYYLHLGREIAFFELPPAPPPDAPRISIFGNAAAISPGDLAPDAGDHTDFGNVVMDQATLQRTFTIENTGSADLLLDDPDPVTVSGSAASDFAVTQPAVSVVPPGGSTTFSVIFDPASAGLRSATISVSSDDPDNDPFAFAIQGMGVVPTVFTWSGLGANDHWSTPGNWAGGMAPPQDGSALVVFPDTPRNSPMIDMPWHVYGIRFEGGDFAIKTFSGESLQIGGGGVVEASATVSLAIFNLPVTLSSDQSWRLEGSNPSLPQIGGGWAIDTNGKQLTIENGSSWGAQFEGGISGAGSLVLEAGGSLSLEGPLSLTGGIRVHENADLTVYDISYSGAIHGVNASFLRFQGSASGPLLPVVTGHFFQIQYIGGSPMRTLELLNPSSSVASYSSGVYGIRLKLGDDAAFGLSHSFSLGGVTGEDATLEAIGGARVLSQRLYRQYASSLVIAGENPITFEGGANLGGYAGETPYIDVREPSGLLRIHGVGFGNHAYPMEKRGAGTLELGGDGNNDFRFPLHVSGGRLALNKATQSGGLHAFAGDLRIGDGSGTDELILLNSNQIADTSKVHLEVNGVFDLGGKQETIARLEGSGTVGNSSTIDHSTLTVAVPAGQTSTFSGTLVDSLAAGSRTLGLKMAGQGTMILTGSSPNSSIQVESGLLQVDGVVGSSSSTVFVTGQGTLCGSGELAGLVTVAGSGGGATLTPGPGVTTLEIGGGVEVYPGAQRFEFEIDGTRGIADRLRVDDFIQLGPGNAALVVTDIQPAGSPAGPLVLVENTSLQPTEGFFSGLPEGAQVAVGAHSYTITYEGGIGGNDVILIPPAPPQPTIQLELPDGGVLSEFAMLDFGSQLGNREFSIAEFYHDRTILIRNTGNAPLTVNWVDVAPDPMSWRYHFQPLNAPYAESIPVGGSREVTVRFQPIQGTFSYLTSQLRISCNDPGMPTRYVMLTGSVIQPVSLQEAIQTAGLVGADALPSATPFDDGVENLLKYAFNMNLAGPDSSRMVPGTGTSGLPAVMLAESSAGPVLRVEFVRRRGSGLVYTPKFSTDLSDFQPMTATEVVTPIDAKWERVTVEQPQDQEGADRGFALVEVTLQ